MNPFHGRHFQGEIILWAVRWYCKYGISYRELQEMLAERGVSDEEYRQLQQDLLVQPDRGDLIKNGGGIRKVRCAQGNKGKSGGIRVIYYWVTEDDQIFFLVAHPKSVKDNLTDKETAILRQLVKEQFHG